MNSTLSPLSPLTDGAQTTYRGYGQFSQSSVSWGAIIAGVGASLALQVLFVLLGAGLGFAIYTPLTDSTAIADLSTGAIVVQGISAVLSLWFGGWIAGRFTPVGARSTGWLHGFNVWCTATVIGVLFVSAGAGWALGDLSKIVDGGLSLAGRPAAALAGGASEIATTAVNQSRDTLVSFTDEAVGHRPAGSTANLNIRAKRDVGLAVARLFNPESQGNIAENRAAVVKALVDSAGLSQSDAEQTVNEWSATYEQLKTDLAAAKSEAEAKAREAADKASRSLAIFSLCGFSALLLGALAAGFGGHSGSGFALKREERLNLAERQT